MKPASTTGFGQCLSVRTIHVWLIAEDLTRSLDVPKSIQTGLQQFCSFQSSTQLVVCPVGQSKPDESFQSFGVWLGCFSTETQTNVRQNWMLGMVALATTAWFISRSSLVAEARAKQANEMLATVVSLSKTDQVPQTCMVLCNQLRKQFSADLVAVSLSVGRDSFRLAAISDVEQVDHAADWTVEVAEACAVGGRLGELAMFPKPEGGQIACHDSLERFCIDHNSEVCISLPLKRPDGSVCATVLIVTKADRVRGPRTVEHYTNMVQMLGPHVDIVARANRGPSQWMSHKLGQLKSANWTAQCVARVSGVGDRSISAAPLSHLL